MKPLVNNAADAGQVQKAGKRQKDRDQEHRADLAAVLKTREGRRTFAWIIDLLQPRTWMWTPSAAVQLNAARHDVGTWIKDRIDEADPHALIRMMQEQRAGEERITEDSPVERNTSDTE